MASSSNGAPHLENIESLAASVDRIPFDPPGEWMQCCVCLELYGSIGSEIPVNFAGQTFREESEGNQYLVCWHSVCKGCADDIFAMARRQNIGASCPTCKSPVSGYLQNDLAMKLAKQCKSLMRARDRLEDSRQGDFQQRIAMLEAQHAETAERLRQTATERTRDREELIRIQGLREQALEELRQQKQQEELSRQALDRELQAHVHALRLANAELYRYRETHARIEDDTALLTALSVQAQKLQDDLSDVHQSLKKKGSEVHAWQIKYQALSDDLQQKEAEIEQLKTALRQCQGGSPAAVSGLKGTAATWMNFATSWLHGDSMFGTGTLTKAEDDYDTMERLGAALDSSVHRAQMKESKLFYAIKRVQLSSGSESGLLQSATTGLASMVGVGGSSSSSPGAAQPLSPLASHAAAASPRKRSLVSVCREAMLLRTLNHENILSLHGFAYLPSGPEALLVMEDMNYDLEFMIESKRLVTEHQCRNILFQVLSAVHYMHSSASVHRSIGSTTILIDESYRVKLGCFRDARSLLSQPLDGVHLSREVGYRFWSPDLVWFMNDPTKVRPSSSSWKWMDIWAVGAVFAEMLLGDFVLSPDTGVRLFDGSSFQKLFHSLFRLDEIRPRLSPTEAEQFPLISDALHNVTRTISLRSHLSRSLRFTAGHNLHPPSKEALDLLFSMLRYDPTSRTDALSALSHPYFLSASFPDPPRVKTVSNLISDAEIGEFSKINLGIKLVN